MSKPKKQKRSASKSREWRNRIVGHGEEDPEQLLANPANWRIHPKPQQDALAGVLSEVGWVQDVIVNRRTGHVVDGHLRVSLAISKRERIPVVYVDLSEEEEQLILATIDPLAAMAAADGEKLADLVRELHSGNEALEALLHGAEIAPAAGLTDDDATPEPPEASVTVLGDLWRLGPHRVLCGDCRDFGSVQRIMGAARANLAVTSPPYASQRKYDESSGFTPIPPDEYVEWFRDVASNISTVLTDDGSYFLNVKEHCDEGQRHLYVKDLTIAHVREWGWLFVDEFAWVRQGVPGGWDNRFKNGWEPIFQFSKTRAIKFRPLAVGTPSDAVFDYSPENLKSPSGSGFVSNRGGNLNTHEGIARPSNVVKCGTGAAAVVAEHSAAFPVGLPEFFIRAYTDPGDSVFDPFMGSGSTLIAAHKNERIGYGTELSPRYCDVIIRRWQDFTGQQATLEETGQTFEHVKQGRRQQATDALMEEALEAAV